MNRFSSTTVKVNDVRIKDRFHNMNKRACTCPFFAKADFKKIPPTLVVRRYVPTMNGHGRNAAGF